MKMVEKCSKFYYLDNISVYLKPHFLTGMVFVLTIKLLFTSFGLLLKTQKAERKYCKNNKMKWSL